MAALYRKYRPQTFAEVVGQEAVVRTLTNAVEQGKVRQAYLFAGPRGTGKTSLARILAKAVNCAHGPTPTPDGTCHACVAIANGTSLDVIEMDAASQRGIDDIRDIRERVVLQPVEGQYKVYILDEAHQLTEAAWNALLKLIEEPPPHLMFVFCTTELQKVLPTVRSRCQTFVFQRPRLPDLVRKLRLISDGEEIDVPDAALALIARGGRGAYRDAESTLAQLAAATGGAITVQDVLQLLGAVEDEVLFRLVDMVAASETAEALLFLEELSSQGQDLGRLVIDLLEHLRHLMLVQHMHEVPESIPVTDEAKERLREQANQLPPASVVRLIDLLAVAVDDMRQGGDPRLPLELALVKVTRTSSDLSREALAHRIEVLEHGRSQVVEPILAREPAPTPAPPPEMEVELGQLQEAWKRTILPAVESKSIPIGKTLAEAHPSSLAGDTLTLEFPQTASFHLKLAEDPKNAAMLREALYEVTGRKLAVDFALGERGHEQEDDDAPATEEDVVELMKSTFDARELGDE
ncbi:MAG TPA: DNA polymerase III subunit gamma/tau [Gaiellaceae bacterium]|nr:DNA polymerase III subunit gamma/tau [Gaiellaceae bacterium]